MRLDPPCDFHACHKRHRVINNSHVGLFLHGPSQGLSAIARLRNNLPAGAPLQDGTQTRPHRIMIVSYENPLHNRTRLQVVPHRAGCCFNVVGLELPGSYVLLTLSLRAALMLLFLQRP